MITVEGQHSIKQGFGSVIKLFIVAPLIVVLNKTVMEIYICGSILLGVVAAFCDPLPFAHNPGGFQCQRILPVYY